MLVVCVHPVVTDSNVPHGLGDGQYELRVKQCAAAVAVLQLKWPNIRKLRSEPLEHSQRRQAAAGGCAPGCFSHPLCMCAPFVCVRCCACSDATLDQLDAVESMMDEEAFYRARHVITENQRTMQSDAQQQQHATTHQRCAMGHDGTERRG